MATVAVWYCLAILALVAIVDRPRVAWTAWRTRHRATHRANWRTPPALRAPALLSALQAPLTPAHHRAA